MNLHRLIILSLLAVPMVVVAAGAQAPPGSGGPPGPRAVLVTPDAPVGAVDAARRRLGGGDIRVWRTGGRLEARGDAAGLLATGVTVAAAGAEARSALGEARASR